MGRMKDLALEIEEKEYLNEYYKHSPNSKQLDLIPHARENNSNNTRALSNSFSVKKPKKAAKNNS